MKILHVAPWASSRVYKQVLAQQWAGWSVTLLYGTSCDAGLHNLVDSWMNWCNESAMKQLTGYDTVVIHTTIGSMKYLEGLTKIPSKRLIWDCHDYCGTDSEDLFDAVVTPSVSMSTHFKRGHCVMSKVPKRLWPEQVGKRYDTCALVATIGNGEAWSNYEGISERLGVPVMIYPSADNFVGHENEFIMKRLPYRAMLGALTRHRYAYAGAANASVNINECVTNKFWEAISAGCEVLTGNSAEMTALLSSDHMGDNAVAESELDKVKEVYHG